MKFIISKSSGLSFSKKTGDFNKIHIDENYSYNSFYGEMICHGCNIFKIGIDKIIKKKIFENGVNQIDITFNKHFSYEKKIYIEKRKFFYNLKQDKKIKAKINYFNNKKFDVNNILDKVKFIKPNYIINIKYKKNQLENLYNIIYLLSKYVGMIYPGENSIIESIKVNYSNKKIKNKSAIYSSKVRKGYPFIKNFMIFKNFVVEFDTLIRPRLVKKNVKPNKSFIRKILKNKDNTLIIGASSGLGNELLNIFELNKKINIYATYFKNIIKNNSKNLNILNLDITKETNKIINLIVKKDIKKIYYFPTNKISMYPSKIQAKIYKKIHFDSPLKILKKICNYKVNFFYPSTLFINGNYQHAEYFKIKKKTEVELRKYKVKYNNLKIKILRLPQLNTKQNLNFINSKDPEFVEYLNLNPKIQKEILFQK